MEEKSYNKLIDPWKNMFNLCAATKSDHMDLNDFKLYYNKKLLEEFLKDQMAGRKRGFSDYGELSERVFLDCERSFYKSGKNGVSIQNIKNAILSSDYVHFDYFKVVDDSKVPHIIIKLIISTLALSKSEETFITANFHINVDEESSSAAIAVATLPRMKKNLNHEMLEKWAKMVILRHLHKTTRVQSYEELKPTLKESVEFYYLNAYARFFI